MSTRNPGQHPRVLDTKTQDTSADQMWRNIGHGMLTVLCLIWLLAEPITGALFTALTIWLVVKASKRRKQRYSDNAIALAAMYNRNGGGL